MSGLEERKLRHIKVSLDENVDTDVAAGFNDVKLIHRCLPEIDLDDVSTKISLFGKTLEAPLIISAITGGTNEAKNINERLAEVAEMKGIGIGVGSQRIAVQKPETAHTFKVVRDLAPDTLVIGNLGCPQLSIGWGVEEAKKCIDMIEADVLALHMNPLQEAVQVGGEARYRGIIEKVEEITSTLSTPVIMKETGAGIAFEEAEKLEGIGVAGLDVSGVGGTSWSAVEHHIAKEVGEKSQEYLGKALWSWGIPTTISLVEVSQKTNLKIIASGGVRTGLDVAKSIALGANAGAMAKPFLMRAVKSSEVLSEFVDQIVQEIRVVMFLTGSRSVTELSRSPAILTGKTAEWLRMRGFQPEEYANR
jgi:isopentenyl-diphosphate delta-isomerase